MRKNPLITNQYYHIYNRGVDKRDIFMNKKDIYRFMLSIKEFNTIYPVGSIRDNIRDELDVKTKRFKKRSKGDTLVSIVCYCLNPNHFHFILKQEKDGGISEFLKRLLGGYSKYFNKTHNRNGALFQGKFRSHLINNDQYFLKIFPYVNINYLIHDIPQEKRYLTLASDKEYEKMDFDIVSKKEAINLLDFYGNNENFKNECLKIISIVREQRGKTLSFLEENISPDVGFL
jgi:REP element-mobilizing transposase RayT